MKNDDRKIAEIKKNLEKNMPEMISFLKEIVKLESPSGIVDRQHELLGFIAGELETFGYRTVHFKGKKTGGVLFAVPRERNKNLPLQLLVGHCDTVWPEGTLSDMPVQEEGQKLRGPGVYDMKAGITQILFALKTIQDLKMPISVVPIVLINSDEEIGSHESTHAITRLARISERAYVLEPPLGVDGKLKTARKGLGRFTISVEGIAAHAGLDPEKGANAIVELSYQVQQLFAMNDLDRGITVNVGTIEGGISPNVIAPISKAVVDVRVLTKEDGEYITEKIMNLKALNPDVKLRVEGGIGRPPMEHTKRNRELWETAKEQAAKMGLEIKEATAGGGSDANTTSLFTATLDGLGTPGDGAHATHEYILQNKIIERTLLLTLMLLTESKKYGS